jgi:hypothetical protein
MHRGVAPDGALDDHIRLGRTLEIRIRDVLDLCSDRIPDLHLPLRAIQRISSLR